MTSGLMSIRAHDIYSLGVVLIYELSSHRILPFESQDGCAKRACRALREILRETEPHKTSRAWSVTFARRFSQKDAADTPPQHKKQTKKHHNL